MRHPKLFFLALGFYTRLPCPKNLDYRQLPQAAVYLPAIGWLVGALSGAAFYLAAGLWPQTTAAIIASITGILVTGAFHEDGFADVCDGFGGGYGKERILEIMKDSAIGVYGTLGLLLLLLMKISLLGSLQTQMVPWVLLAGHSISRLMPLGLMRSYSYARSENSKSGIAMFSLGFSDLFFATSMALLPFIFLPGNCLLAVIPVVLSTLWLGHYFDRHIGGYTGDCLGACQQVGETVFYLSLSALWTST
ncbi:adenosylcobinamide-GDP ribazoletransferase [Methylomicrobium lacus]|uniref:adenosylcobinamide-GDP ribazoletransferase n=1 Tax=Methylomicrobium lacus TaxID=136992 RepID=UPI0035A82813